MKNIELLGNQASNIEARDAFTNYIDITAAETMNTISKKVTLYRPFAQLNLGTTEGSLTNNAGTFTLQSSVIKVKGIADNFNTVSGFGTVSEANKDIEYTFFLPVILYTPTVNEKWVNALCYFYQKDKEILRFRNII